MDGISEDYNCFQPNHFVILDSQNSCPKPLNESSFLKSLPALQIPETQTEHVGINLSPNQNSAVSETYQYDIDLIDSFNSSEVTLKFLKTPNMESNKSVTTHSESSSEDSRSYFYKPLQPSFIEDPHFKQNPSTSTGNVACKKSSSSEDSKSVTVQNVTKSTEKAAESKNILTGKPEEIKSTILARRFLFKSDQEDTTSDDKDSEPEVNTPSRHIHSLQVSPMSVIVSDTADEMNYIEPSPEHQSFPIIIPDSPTMDNSDQDSGSQESTVMESTVIKDKKSQHQPMENTQNEGIKDSKNDSDSLKLHYTSTQTNSEVDPKICSQKDVATESNTPAHEICESQDLNLYLSFNSQISEIKDMTQSSQANKAPFMLKEEKSNQSVHSVFKDSSSEDVLEFTLNLPKASPGSSLRNPSFSKTPQSRSSLRKTSISQTSQKESSFGHPSISQSSQKGSDLGNSSVSQTSQKGSGLGNSAGDKMKKSYHDSIAHLSNSEVSQQTSSSLNAANPHKTQQHQGNLPSQLNPSESFQEANPFDSEYFFKTQQKDLLDSCPGKNSQKDQQKGEPCASASELLSKSATSSAEGCVSKISNEKRINEEDLLKKTILDSCLQKGFTKIQDKKDTLSSKNYFTLIHEGAKHFSGSKPRSCGLSSSQGAIDIRAGDANGSSQEDERERQKPASLPDKLISKGNDKISSKSKPADQPGDISQNPYSNDIIMPENNSHPMLASTSSQNNNSNAKESIMPYEEEEEEQMNVFKMQMLTGNISKKGVSLSQTSKILSTECPGKMLSASVPGWSSCSIGETSRTITEITHVDPPVMPTVGMAATAKKKTPLNILGKKQYSPLVARDIQVSGNKSFRQDDISIVQPVKDVANNVPDHKKQLTVTQDLNIGACTSNDPYIFPDSQTKNKPTIVTTRKRQKVQSANKFIQKKTSKKLLPKKSTIFSRNRGIRKDRQSPVYRVRFEAIRKRARNPIPLNSNPAFLKVPSHKDIESILSSKMHNIGDKTPSSSDSGSHTKELQQQQCSLYTNLKKVLQRKITEETVVQIVYLKTTVEMLRNSQVIDRRVFVEKNDPVVIKSTRNEEFKYLNSSKGKASFCSPTSLTSGEYADVSSLSHSDSKGSSNNSGSFSSLTVKSSSLELPTPPSVKQSEKHHKESKVNTLKKRQSVSSKPCQSHTSDEDVLKMLSPITLEDKQEHSAYCSPGDDLQQQSWDQLGTHRITATPDKCNTSVTKTATLSRYSSDNAPLKTKATMVLNSDSLFSSTENLSVSDRETAVHHTKILPVTQPSRIVRVCPEIFPSNKNLNLPGTSSNKSSVQTSAHEENMRTPNIAEKQIRGSKRFCSSDPSKGNKCSKKHKQDFSDDKSKCSDKSQSPVIPFQDQGNIASQSTVQMDVFRQQPAIGILVMARWKDGFFYPGKIASPEKNGKYLVIFVDGDKLWVKINQILSITYLPQGQNVMVQSNDGFFDSGMIINYKYNGSDSDEDVLYQVQMEDSRIVVCSRKQVILSENQAVTMLSDEDFLLLPGVPSTPLPSGGDVSLDNLVDGSRRSASRKVLSESEKTKKLTRMEPQAMSTPTHKRKASVFRKESDTIICHIGAAIASPKHNYEETNRRAKKELFDVVKGPIPKKSLFNTMNFLLTYTEKSPEQKLLDKKLLQEFSSESSTNLSYSDLGVEPKVPFDKNHLRLQLEAGGGTVFSSWHQDFLCDYKTSFVVSNNYQRTVKYLQGLAAGIPCISHLWVRDCCKQGTLLDYKSYMLQAGISITKKSLIESKMKFKCLEDLETFVTSSQHEFVNIWSEILTIAGCKIRKKFRKSKGSNKFLDVVITDGSCSPDIIEQAESQNIPLLSTEWVIQCLIHGQKIAFDGHEKYVYNYEENV